jgi:hypothetical protein
VADGDEHALQVDVLGGAGLDVLDAHAGDAGVVAQDFVEGGVELEHDLAGGDLLHDLVHQDALGLELVAAVHQRDLAGDVGEVERLFDGGVAAADHRDFLVAVEEAVAGGAGRHALAGEGFFGRQAEVLGAGAGGDDQRVAGVFARIAHQADRLFGQMGGVDVVEDHLGVEAQRVLLEARHQLGPCTPSASAGQLSTSVVVISWPPWAMPVMSTGFRLARAA